MTVGTNTWRYGGSQHRVSNLVMHPAYHHATIKNDIGVVITSTVVAINNNVRPVVLSFDYVGSNVPVRVAGWGAQRVSCTM